MTDRIFQGISALAHTEKMIYRRWSERRGTVEAVTVGSHGKAV